MSIEIKAPSFPESVQEGTVATWHKAPGEPVERDELIVDIETDKVVLEVVAPESGSIKEILKQEGDTVLSQELIAVFEAGEASAATPAAASNSDSQADDANVSAEHTAPASPAARKLMEEKGIDKSSVSGSGKDGRITKEDVMNASAGANAAPAAAAPAPAVEVQQVGDRTEKRVPMTRLRASIAKRLVEAQQTAAMLTTFNEVNMQPVMNLRKTYKDVFEKTHDTRLGFMSFFVKATVEALKRFPSVNASIDGSDIVYHGYQDVGVAVSSNRGLVVPVLRNADDMGLADIEKQIRDYGVKAQAGKLGLEEMQGGTFTVSNGGVFGSLMSTPILNPPQTAILGMHKIQERPMAVNGKVEILPMMYLALSYDHRMIDGKEAVQFLVAIKEMVEDPAKILLEI